MRFSIYSISSSRFLLLLLIPIFLFSSDGYLKSVKLAETKELHNSHVWHSLLHLNKDENPSIDSGKFLLSHKKFSPRNELQATLLSFFDDKRSICKYPARFLWLKQELELPMSMSDSDCIEFNEYLYKTTPKDLKIIFASEQVESPMSMMGHVFFKLEGVDGDGVKRENAVSFFTVIDTANIPYLILKSTVTGMNGYFILSPYKKHLKRYLNEDERNIWEYELNLTNFEKKLIYYHFWELKSTDIKYLFTDFNCATIIDDMLALSRKNYRDDFSLWVTPKDVIKRAYRNNIIKKSKMEPAPGWEVKMLVDSLDREAVSTIKSILENKNLKLLKEFRFNKSVDTAYLEKKLFLSYANYLNTKKDMFSDSEIEEIKKTVQDDKNLDLAIDISQYKNPVKSPKSSQVTFSRVYGDKNGLEFSFLPASNRLHDDNRQYFTESSLKIGEITVSKIDDEIKLKRFEILSMKSLAPWDTLTRSVSKEFSLNIEPQYDKDLKEHQVLNANLGAGFTKRLTEDFFMYTLADIGFATNYSNNYIYASPKLGFMIYEVFNMKSVAEVSRIYNQMNSKTYYDEFTLDHSIFVDKNVNVGFRYNLKKSSNISAKSTSIFASYIF